MRKGTKRLLALLLGAALIAGPLQAFSLRAEAAGGGEKEPANSWRYKDGRLIETPSKLLRGASKNTWKKVNGTYRNAKNQVIPGAVKRGIDVSKWQGNMNWAKVKKSDVSFAIIRCGYIKRQGGNRS